MQYLLVVVAGCPQLIGRNSLVNDVEGFLHSVEICLKADLVGNVIELMSMDVWELELDGEYSLGSKG